MKISPAHRDAVTILLEDLWQELGAKVRRKTRLLTDDSLQLSSLSARRLVEKSLEEDLLHTGENANGPMTSWEVYEVFRGRLLGASPIQTSDGVYYLNWPATEIAELEKRMMTIHSYSHRLKHGGLEALAGELPGVMAIMLRVAEICYALREKWKQTKA